MAMKLINESSLVAIGDAIRAKNGSSNTYSPAEMATAISNISSGGESIPSNMLNVTGSFESGFQNFFGEKMRVYLPRMTFNDITSIKGAFSHINTWGIDNNFDWTDWSSITINFQDGTGSSFYDGYCDASSAFTGYSSLRYLPKMNFTNTGLWNCQNIFNSCAELRSVSDFMNNGIFLNTTQGRYNGMFAGCYKLEEIPRLEKLATLNTYNYTVFYSGFPYCYNLKEILNLPTVGTYSSNNLFRNTFDETYSLSKLTFETENGNAKTATWKSAVISLGTGKYVGYFKSDANTFYALPGRNRVVDQATYEQYKNTNYYTTLVEYSRYNHDSAVETINSLPDTSATGTNTIQFLGNSGSATDGGAISNLTSAEIAVATAKGWNVVIQ